MDSILRNEMDAEIFNSDKLNTYEKNHYEEFKFVILNHRYVFAKGILVGKVCRTCQRVRTLDKFHRGGTCKECSL